jgi:hypothetical protein
MVVEVVLVVVILEVFLERLIWVQLNLLLLVLVVLLGHFQLITQMGVQVVVVGFLVLEQVEVYLILLLEVVVVVLVVLLVVLVISMELVVLEIMMMVVLVAHPLLQLVVMLATPIILQVGAEVEEVFLPEMLIMLAVEVET